MGRDRLLNFYYYLLKQLFFAHHLRIEICFSSMIFKHKNSLEETSVPVFSNGVNVDFSAPTGRMAGSV